MEPITFATEGYMASQYIGQIKQAISQYFPAISPEDAAALAWGGLTNTAEFQNLVSSNPSLAQNYVNINKDYRDGKKGTKPCIQLVEE